MTSKAEQRQKFTDYGSEDERLYCLSDTSVAKLNLHHLRIKLCRFERVLPRVRLHFVATVSLCHDNTLIS